MRHFRRAQAVRQRRRRDGKIVLPPLAQSGIDPAEQRHGEILRRQALRLRQQSRLAEQHAQQPLLRHGGADVVVAQLALERLNGCGRVHLPARLLALLLPQQALAGAVDLHAQHVRRKPCRLGGTRAVDLALHRRAEARDKGGGLLGKFHLLLVL